jgi:hypothetical protein
MEDVVLYFLDIGFRDEDIPKVVTRFPQAMSLSLENNLQKKCEFYIDNISHDLSPIVAMPSYLGMSLEKRYVSAFVSDSTHAGSQWLPAYWSHCIPVHCAPSE